MAALRLYREIYKINYNYTGLTYTLINPYLLNATIYDAGNNVIETPIVINESIGVYYTDLNPILYSFDNIYELRWNITYIVNGLPLILKTRFKLSALNISSEIQIELINNQRIEYEIDNTEITIEVK